MSYMDEYEKVKEQLHPSYHPFIETIRKIVSLTDEIFVQQIDDSNGVYNVESKKWIKDNPYYVTQSLTVVRIKNGNSVEIPYSKYYTLFTSLIVSLLEDAKKQLEHITDTHLDKEWWQAYLYFLQKGFGENNWKDVEIHFLSLSENSPLFLTIGPIDTYHDKILGTKKFFSAWLLVKKNKEQDSARTLWKLLTITAKENSSELNKLYIGNLLYSGGEVAKFNSMGWSRPDDVSLLKKYGAVKAIALNKLKEHTQTMWEAMESSMKKWETPKELTDALETFHKEKSLLPLLLHEFGHTYQKSEKASDLLGKYYPFIEEARANTNMLYLAYELEKQHHLPPNSARIIFLRVLFYLKYLHEEYTLRQQREAYYYAALLWLSKAEEYKIVSLTEDRLSVDMQKIDEQLPQLLIDIKIFLQILTESGAEGSGLEHHKKAIFTYGKKVTKNLF